MELDLNMYIYGLSDSTAGKILAMHAIDLGSNSGILFGPQMCQE